VSAFGTLKRIEELGGDIRADLPPGAKGARALDELKGLAATMATSRPDWPVEVHRQYLLVLDERDELQGKVDELVRGLAGAEIEIMAFRSLPPDVTVGKAVELLDHMKEAGRQLAESQGARRDDVWLDNPRCLTPEDRRAFDAWADDFNDRRLEAGRRLRGEMKPGLHDPWDARCAKRIHGEPTDKDARCRICNPEQPSRVT